MGRFNAVQCDTDRVETGHEILMNDFGLVKAVDIAGYHEIPP